MLYTHDIQNSLFFVFDKLKSIDYQRIIYVYISYYVLLLVDNIGF